MAGCHGQHEASEGGRGFRQGGVGGGRDVT